jgi:hypothetical protein
MAHSTALVPLCPANDPCRQLSEQPGLPLAAHLPGPLIDASCAACGHGFRHTIYTPAVTLWTFLHQVLDPDHSCRQAVARLLAYRSSQGLPACSADTGAYCKARARLPEEVLAELTRASGRVLAEQAEGHWLWKGRRVKVVDGTTLSMPDTPANQRVYPQPQALPAGTSSPLLRLVTVFDLAVGTVVDAAMARHYGKGTGEVPLLRSLQGVLQKGDVLLGDRLYATFWTVWWAKSQGVDVAMRMHVGRAKVWFRGRGHKKSNRRIWWQKPQRPCWMTPEQYAAIPNWLRLRAVRLDVRKRGRRTKQIVLVSTLLREEDYGLEDLSYLYRQRWLVELRLRYLKTVLQMDILRGQTPEMVRKEIWAHLLVYNVLRTVMAQAARRAQVFPEEISFKGALQTLNAFLPQWQGALTMVERLELWQRILSAVARHRVGQRPDRYEPRVKKRRPKNYPRLRVPRAQAREQMAARTMATTT